MISPTSNPSRASSNEKLELLRRPEVSVMVTDLMMPGMDGQELLKAARAVRPDVEVVLMTAYGTVETAVASMKEGAYDFITKPLKRHSLVKVVNKALEKQALLAENRDLKARLADLGAPGGRSLVGQSPAFRALMDMLRQAAPSSATVLLVGQSGTGKELAARAIHEFSTRATGPFVAVNCAAFTETLLESEPVAERSFWTRSAKSLPRHKSSSCASFKRVRSSGWAARKPFRWTCAWWRRRSRTCARR